VGERTPTRLDEAVLVSGTLAYGLALQKVIPERWHVPANVAAALAALAVARHAGASSADCGLAGAATRPGLRAGGAAAAVSAAGIVLVSRPGRTRALFSEERITGHGGARAVYEVLVRIPVGTALGEEVLFRGALLGVLLRRHGPAAAVARASLCFGLWHVPPTLPSLRSSVLGRQAQGRVGAIAAVASVVAVTTVAGTGFAALRLRTGSVVAAVLAHAAVNATAYVVARSARR
jgi:membrane protease YdiL (CAAX protease family)